MGINPGIAAASLDTQGGPGGKFFPGIVPAAINEASEIMAQLNVPFRTHVEFKYDKRGLVTDIITTQVTPLMLIMAVSAPAVVVAVLKILELAAGTGKAWGPNAQDIAETVVDKAVAAGEGLFDIFGRIWNLSTAIPGFVTGIP